MIEDLVRMVLKLPPGVRKINHDLGLMRDLVKPVVDQLIPFQDEQEMELMSLKFDIKTQKQGLDKIIRGSVYSIYYEPMVTFAYKDYIKGTRDALLYCRTRSSEFIYRIKKRDVDVYYNGHQVALIDPQSVMHGLRSKNVLGRIKPYSNDLLSIVVKEKEVGQMFNPRRSHSPQQRAYSLMSNLKEEEQGIFLSLTLYILLTGLIENKK
jgi:hypothetical protein